jgi:hypothetical protein
MKQTKKEKINALPAILLIAAGLLLNPWVLSPLLRLSHGHLSPLRLIVVLLFEITAISIGIYGLKHRKTYSVISKNTLFPLLSVLLALITVEFALHLLTWLSPSVAHVLSGRAIPLQISDERLGYRPNPAHPDHDARGFRNRISRVQADIVAIGDSQTYGMAVRREQAWPQQIETLSGRTVYNMSFGGYGCVEGLALLEEAKQLQPTIVIFAMFFGNDLVDAFKAVYYNHLYPEFKDPALQNAIQCMEQTAHLLEEIRKITWKMWQKDSEPVQKNNSFPESGRKNSFLATVKKAKLLRLFFAVERYLNHIYQNSPERRFFAIKNGQVKYPEIFEIFEVDQYKTVFTPEYRFIAMNLDDPRIAEGLSISLKALDQMKKQADANHFELLVLLIPTKERVFSAVLDHYNLDPSESMQWLLEQESRLNEQVQTFLSQHNIPFLDAEPALKRILMEGKQPYFVDADGHLNAIGHHAIARQVHEFLLATEKRRLRKTPEM